MASPYTATFRDGTPYPVVALPATAVPVANQSELTTKLAALAPGQRLVLGQGSYTSLTVTGKAGTSSAPIAIVAQSDGGPVFSGKGSVEDCAYLTVRGLAFPSDPAGDLFQFRGTSHHWKLHRCTFGPAAHPGSANTGESGSYIYVGDDCENFQISYCELRNKSRAGNGVRVYGNFDTNQMCQYGVIDHNDIHDFYPSVVNDFEPIRVGVSTMSLSDSFVHVERNVISGIKSEPEIISIKSGKCRVFGNSILQSAGGPCIRHGLGTIMTDNYVIDGQSTTNGNGEGSGGPRWYDADHEVAYNLLQGLSGTSYQAALQLDGGESGTTLSRHAAVKNARVHHNIVVECATPITVNAHYSVKPSSSRIEDNLVAASGSAAVQYFNGATAATTGTVARNDWFASAAAAGLVKGSDGAYSKAGYGPRVPMLRRADVGPAGDLTEADQLGNGTGGGGNPGGGGEDPGGGGSLVVSAGPAAAVYPGAPFTRVATAAGTGSVASWTWTIAAVPAGGPGGLIGTTIGSAAGLSWTAPTAQGVYRLQVVARDSDGVALGSATVDVEVTTNPAAGGTIIDVVLDPIGPTDVVPLWVVESVVSTVAEIPIYPGEHTYPGPATFPGTTVDPRYTRPRTGWTLYPGPTTFPGADTYPGYQAGGEPPPWDVELWLLDDAGGYRCPLPDVRAATLNRVAGDVGSVEFGYPVDGRNFDQLREHVDAGVDARIAVRFCGTTEWELQAVLDGHGGDDVAEAAVWQFTGAWSDVLLAETAVEPAPGSDDGKIGFVDATPGAILTELAAHAQARGAFDIDTSTFDAEFDSHGEPWAADTISSPTFAAGDSSTYLRVLQLMADAGLCEWAMTGTRLRLYRPGGRGRDLTHGVQVVLQGGRDLREASRRSTVAGAVTSLLVLGAGGERLWVEDDTALGTRRRRVEGTLSQGGLSGGALRAYGRAKLAGSTRAKVERVHKLIVADGHPAPMREFDIGDLAWSDADGTRRALRVAQWTLTLDDQGWSASVSLGDLIDDPLVKVARKLLGIGDGTTVLPGGTGAQQSEALTPAAPTGVVVESVTSAVADGSSRATLLVSWDPVVLAADGVTGVAVTGYRLRWRQLATVAGMTLAGEWSYLEDLADTAAQVDDVPPDVDVEVQVAAYAVITTTSTPTEPGGGAGPGGGGGDSTLPPRTQAAQLILARLESGSSIFEDWTWTGYPVLVGQHNDALLTAAAASGLSGPDWPFSAAAKTWLRQYIATHQAVEVPTTMAGILRLGFGDGLTKVNLGVDYLPGQGPVGKQGKHVDYDLTVISNDLVIPNYAEIRPDGAVRLTAHVGAATTPNSKKSRTEYRELDRDGRERAFWSSKRGEHYAWIRFAVRKLPTGRQRMCVLQAHAVSDDLGMILIDQGTNVESTFGDTGRPGRLTSELELDRVYQAMMRLVREDSQTLIHYYWDDMTSPAATQAYSGDDQNYFKFGNYQQSEPKYDDVGETAILDLYDCEIWHTGYPTPAPRR